MRCSDFVDSFGCEDSLLMEPIDPIVSLQKWILMDQNGINLLMRGSIQSYSLDAG